MKALFNWIANLILDENSKLPSTRKVISYIFTVLGIFLVLLASFIVYKMDQGRFGVSADKLRALDMLKDLLYICCGMILLLLAVVTMQQLINFRTNSIYNSPPGVAPVESNVIANTTTEPETPETPNP